MNDTRNWILGIVIVALAAIVSVVYTAHRGPVTQSTETGMGAPGTSLLIENYIPAILYNGGYYSALGITTTGDVSAAAGTFTGALTTTATTETIGGITQTFSRQSLATATNTPCAIQSPAATSTWQSWGVNISTGTSTAGVNWTVATSATAFATTTVVANGIGIPASQTRSFAGPTSTPTTFQNGAVLAPSTWIVMALNGVVGGFTYVGTCQSTFQSLN